MRIPSLHYHQIIYQVSSSSIMSFYSTSVILSGLVAVCIVLLRVQNVTWKSVMDHHYHYLHPFLDRGYKHIDHTAWQLVGILARQHFYRLLNFTVILITLIYMYPRFKEYRRVRNLINKIPGPPVHPIPFIGHAKVVLDLDRAQPEHGTYALIYQMLSGIYCLYGKEKLLRMWMTNRPVVLLFDPDSVEAVLSSHALTEKASEYNWLKPWIGEGLVTSAKSKWKQRRKILTPAFHFKILQDFFPTMNEQADILINKIKKLHRDGKTDPFPNILALLTLTTLDIVCETAMGTSVHAQTSIESVYVKCLHQVSHLMIYRLTRPYLWPDFLFYSTQHGRRFRTCLNKMRNFTEAVIQDRKQYWISHNQHLLTGDTACSAGETEKSPAAGKKRLAFLDLLLHEHLVNKTLTEEDIIEEVETFMFAGHDTTAMGISWTLYLIGLHPEIQERVRREVDLIFDEEEAQIRSSEQNNNNDGNEATTALVSVTEDMMKKMKYLDCVLKEVQRLYPTAPFIGRELTEDTEISGYLVPKGTCAGVLTFLLHRNPKIFPNPEKFDPDRFLPENYIGRHPFAYVPFSAGPRNCIGQKYAIAEQKIVVSSLIRNFKFTSLDQRDKLVVVGEMVLRPKNDIRIRIEPRKDVGLEKRVVTVDALPVERSISPTPISRVL